MRNLSCMRIKRKKTQFIEIVHQYNISMNIEFEFILSTSSKSKGSRYIPVTAFPYSCPRASAIKSLEYPNCLAILA